MKINKLIFIFILRTSICDAQETGKQSVYFNFDEYRLDLISMNEIDSVFNDLNILELNIEAHCDSVGGNLYNDKLSMKRAGEVKKYLLSKGINETNIHIKTFGKRAPVNNNADEKERALNRRADIFFIRNKPEPAIIPDTVSRDSSVLNVENAEVGSTIRLQNLNFVGGRHVLLPHSENTLQSLLKIMKSNPGLVIQIQGHVCCVPYGEGYDFDTHSYALSVNRAKAIYDYLVNNGIDAKRLSYRGFGSSRKLVEERTEEDQSTNRRVEIKIIKK